MHLNSLVLHIIFQSLWPKEFSLNHSLSSPEICQLTLGFSCCPSLPILKGEKPNKQTNKQILPLFLDQELQSECPQTGLPKFMLILLLFFFLFCSQRVGFVRKGARERSGKEGNRNIKKKSNNLPRRANMGNKIDGLKWGEGLSRILSGVF